METEAMHFLLRCEIYG